MKLLITLVGGLLSLAIAAPNAHAAKRPNIVWFVIDDMSANFSCYGEATIQTPHVDRLAQEGLRFTRAYATSPVCSTFRSAMITGMYQTSIGVHHHRSGRGEHRIKLPDGVRPIPAIFQEAGYYTCIGSGLNNFDYRTQPFSSSTKSRLTTSIGTSRLTTVTTGPVATRGNLSSCRCSYTAENFAVRRRLITNALTNKSGSSREIYRKNAELYRRWARKGK